MKTYLTYGAIVVTLGILDLIWLTAIKGFVMNQVGHLFAPKMVSWAVVLFYVIYAGAVLYFAVLPSATPMQAALKGALLGFTAYMTYDLVNLATLSGWTLKFALVDMSWGTVITAAAAFVGALVL